MSSSLVVKTLTGSIDPLAFAQRLCGEFDVASGPISILADAKTTQVGAFLDAALDFSTGLFSFPNATYPQLVDDGDLSRGEHGPVGAALDQWMQLNYSDDPKLEAVIAGIRMSPAPAAIAGMHLLTNLKSISADPERCIRAAVALGWFDSIYHSSGIALVGSPVNECKVGGNSESLLALVPDRIVQQVTALARLAGARIGTLLGGPAVRFQTRLNHRTAWGDIDVVAGGVLLDVKTSLGGVRKSGRQFALSKSMLRQILGYALLDLDDELGISGVGIYAARYGLLWTIEIDELLHHAGPFSGGLQRSREAFAVLLG
jgi:hypothetical protein